MSHLGYSRDTAGIQQGILDRFWRNRPKMKKAPLGGLPDGFGVPIKKVGQDAADTLTRWGNPPVLVTQVSGPGMESHSCRGLKH